MYRLKERLAIAEVALGLIKIIHAGRFKKKKTKPYLANEVEAVLLSTAVLIAQAGGKPKSASAIARSLGMSRTTAQRKLIELEKIGVVERRGNVYLVTDVKMGEDDYIDKAMSLIRRAAQL